VPWNFLRGWETGSTVRSFAVGRPEVLSGALQTAGVPKAQKKKTGENESKQQRRKQVLHSGCLWCFGIGKVVAWPESR